MSDYKPLNEAALLAEQSVAFQDELAELRDRVNYHVAEADELRASLAKEKERADIYQDSKHEYQKLWLKRGEELAAERQRADKAEAERDAFDREWPGIMATKRKLIAERDALRAECERLKAQVTGLQIPGPLGQVWGAMEWDVYKRSEENARANIDLQDLAKRQHEKLKATLATLAEREAQLERVRNKCEDHFGERTACGQCFDSVRSALREREAQLKELEERFQKQVDLGPLCHSAGPEVFMLTYADQKWIPIEKLREREAEIERLAADVNKARDERDAARKEALEEAAKLVERDNRWDGDYYLSGTVDQCGTAEAIRALASDAKGET